MQDGTDGTSVTLCEILVFNVGYYEENYIVKYVLGENNFGSTLGGSLLSG